jgi:ATP/maltotriose-dependent transcriptional regulator MalT
MWRLSAFTWGHFMLGGVTVLQGSLSDAQQLLDRAVELARQHADTESEGWAQLWMVDLALVAGDPDRAMGPGQRGLEIAEKMGSVYSRAIAYLRLGAAHLLNERWKPAVESLEQSLDIMRGNRTALELEARALAWLAEAVLGTDDLTRAHDLAHEAATLSRERGARQDGAFAQLSLARVLLSQQGVDAAETIRAALDAGDEVTGKDGVCNLRPLLLVERAKLAGLEGDADARDRHLRAALPLFETMGAPLRVRQVEALLAG